MKQVLLVVVCLFVATEALAQQPTRSEYGLPLGSWSIGCGPRLERGPVVDLYKTGSSVLTGITVRDIWLENRSNQSVAGIKVAWRIYNTCHQRMPGRCCPGSIGSLLTRSVLFGTRHTRKNIETR